MSREFYETRKLFIPYVNYKNPLTYDEWLVLPNDKKAAHLYCQFFTEIVSAWYKAKSFYASEQEGVETVLQYIIKNVSKIEEDAKRFTAPYIYRMAYNCLYCIAHDRKIDRWRYENEISIYQTASSGDELDILDFCACYDNYSVEESEEDKMIEAWFWQIVESCDIRAQRLAEDIISGTKVIQSLCKRDSKILAKIRDRLLAVLPLYYKDAVVNSIIDEFTKCTQGEMTQ